VLAEDPVECVDLREHPEAMDSGGFWVVVGEFAGAVRAWRFATVRRGRSGTGLGPQGSGSSWLGPPRTAWRSSLYSDAYRARVEHIRAAVREGEVYQVNLCRVMSAPLPAGPDGSGPDPEPLARVLEAGNPAPFAGGIHVPCGSGLDGVWVVSASPELFLRVDGGTVTSGPIKGTASHPGGLTEKDRAENVMIADMVRNDLQKVCGPGTVEVTSLLAVEHHPGLVHLVTTVQGALLPGTGWAGLLAATYPPASVSGAPKHSALSVIRRVEPVDRGPYCGTIGWVDADAGRAELAVAIRTFWWTDADGGTLHFGTGAGITWGSDADLEWAETELKAQRLVDLASRGSTGPG
jgi:para-aminobenzoate synthetase component I